MTASRLITGDCREELPRLAAKSVQMCVTSPPYWALRNYNVEGQLGLEPTPEEYVATMVQVFREVRRVLRDDGVLFLNLGDSYANDAKWGGSTGGKHSDGLHGDTGIGRRKVITGLKPKDLIGIPWRAAFALQADGWYLRQDIIWSKPNPMPESVTDRCTKAHEYVFMLSKSPKYYFDAEAIKEETVTDDHNRFGNKNAEARLVKSLSGNMKKGAPEYADRRGRNKRSVWTIATAPYSEAHFATFPPALIEPCILAGSRPGDVVLDPFFGSGTTGEVCERLGRKWLGVELNPEYGEMSKRRTAQQGLGL